LERNESIWTTSKFRNLFCERSFWTENLPSENDVIEMIKRIAYISILLVWGCNSLIEKSAPLEGNFYIQDGWLAFSSSKYDEADKHFNTAIETNDSGSVFHFLSLVGLGWSNIYKAHMIEGTSSNGYVNDAGERLNAANNLMLNINIEEITFDLNEDYFNGITDMYAGLALQRSYFAKQKSANENAWETTNESLSDTVRILYEESIDFSIQLESDYIFQHDVKLTYNDILVLRTQNYLILGNIEEAILSFNQIDFDQLGFEVNEACEQGVDFDASKLIECLCIVSHNGFCPFGDLND
jgi:hypothetical protein